MGPRGRSEVADGTARGDIAVEGTAADSLDPPDCVETTGPRGGEAIEGTFGADAGMGRGGMRDAETEISGVAKTADGTAPKLVRSDTEGTTGPVYNPTQTI